MKIGRAAELIANFKRSGLLAFDADGVDAVDDFDFAGLAEFANDAQCFVEIAFDRNRGRAVHQRLRQFAEGDFAVGQQHDAFHFGARGVSGRGGGSVAGAGANDDLRAAFLGFGDGHGHAAIFEGAGRIQCLRT